MDPGLKSSDLCFQHSTSFHVMNKDLGENPVKSSAVQDPSDAGDDEFLAI